MQHSLQFFPGKVHATGIELGWEFYLWTCHLLLTHRMGLTNPDVMSLTNGMQLSNCYLSFTTGPTAVQAYQPPLTFTWTVDSDGVRHFFANGTLYIYLSEASKAAGNTPIQIQQVSIPADESSDGVFSVFYAALLSKYANGVVDMQH